MDQREELDRKLAEAEERQADLEKDLDEIGKTVDSLIAARSSSGGGGSDSSHGRILGREELERASERAAMGSLSKELTLSMDALLFQLKHLVSSMNGEYEQQLGKEQQHTQV